MDIEKFNPTVAELNAIVERSKEVTITDPHNSAEVEAVKKSRMEVVKARTTIQKTGKELRAEATAFGKAVIAKEKELIDIILPEEERLKGLEAEAKRQLAREDRAKLLPERKKKLEFAELEIPEDDFILDMDNEAFALYYAEQLEAKMEAKRAEEEKAKAIEEAKETLKKEDKKVKAGIAKNDAYQDFLREHEYNKVTDVLEETDKEVRLYRLVAKLKK